MYEFHLKAVSKVEHMTVTAAGNLIWAEGDYVGPVKLRPYRFAADPVAVFKEIVP